jgi:hypothetical protein
MPNIKTVELMVIYKNESEIHKINMANIGLAISP